MKVFRDLNKLPVFQNGVLTIGTFDGVHTGHQKILSRINTLAQEHKGESIILTFHPHPRLIINPNDTSLKLLNTLEEKIALLEHYKVDNLVIAPFSRDFSEISAHDYIEEFLWKKFRPKVVVIGYDHRFGNNREGGIDMIKSFGKKLGFEVEEISKQMVDDLAVSSTKVRNALLAGEVEQATRLLNHPFSITGTVVKGDQIGHTIGFPTANIQVNSRNKLVPGNGVYAVRITLKQGRFDGMLNIGLRPTVDGKKETIEAHIFDFEGDIYGENITVEFVATIRREQKFESVELLAKQLGKDKERAKELLQNI